MVFLRLIFQVYEKKRAVRWKYDLGWKTNFEQVKHIETLSMLISNSNKLWEIGRQTEQLRILLKPFCTSDLLFFFIQVFGTRKLFWFFPLFAKEDLEKMPALHGLDFPTRSDIEAWGILVTFCFCPEVYLLFPLVDM